jgi:hypothetical protein
VALSVGAFFGIFKKTVKIGKVLLNFLPPFDRPTGGQRKIGPIGRVLPSVGC